MRRHDFMRPSKSRGIYVMKHPSRLSEGASHPGDGRLGALSATNPYGSRDETHLDGDESHLSFLSFWDTTRSEIKTSLIP